MKNPKNAEIVTLHLDSRGKYHLAKPFPKHQKI